MKRIQITNSISTDMLTWDEKSFNGCYKCHYDDIKRNGKEMTQGAYVFITWEYNLTSDRTGVYQVQHSGDQLIFIRPKHDQYEIVATMPNKKKMIKRYSGHWIEDSPYNREANEKIWSGFRDIVVQPIQAETTRKLKAGWTMESVSNDMINWGSKSPEVEVEISRMVDEIRAEIDKDLIEQLVAMAKDMNMTTHQAPKVATFRSYKEKHGF